jgi:alpha-tubulin suppressor-like RCC1 family protein
MGDNLPTVDLGTGRTATAISLGSAQSAHTCALLDNAAVKCWGQGAYGQLGQGNTTTLGDGANEMGENLTAIDLGTGRTATAISLGNYHTCVLLDNASVKCWGRDPYGQLGQGSAGNLGDGANEMGDNLPAIDL